MTLAERAVMRIREEMTERHVTQRDLAKDLKCSQGRVAKLLNAGVHLRINDVAILADAVGITVVEAIRDRGLEFYAELTPSEVRILEYLRRSPNIQNLLMAIIEAGRVTKSRGAVPKRRDPDRPPHTSSVKKRA